MDLNSFINMPSEPMPADIKQKLESIGNITKTTFADKNDVLTNADARYDCGYDVMKDAGGYYLVSMYAPMPDVTEDMVKWWFWWHPQAPARYKAWFPTEHKGISFSKKNKAYFAHTNTPPFERNTQYPYERVGKLTVPLAIDFVDPIEFGFSKTAMEQNNVATIVCGHVSAFYGLIPNTEMAHIFFKTEKGLLLVSRFWLGINVKNAFLKKRLVTEAQAKDMAYHCCIEYRNFAKRIPLMYKTQGN